MQSLDDAGENPNAAAMTSEAADSSCKGPGASQAHWRKGTRYVGRQWKADTCLACTRGRPSSLPNPFHPQASLRIQGFGSADTKKGSLYSCESNSAIDI